ncbi:transcriptional regulator MalT, partial [Vibrio sp. Y176]|nr:transcriptional regulator MalT [Vibrio sp. Y176]
SNDKDLVVEILNEFGWKMFNQGELSTLEHAINKLDAELLFSHPKLTMLRAWLAQSQHRYNQVGQLLEEAEEEHKKRNIELDIHYQGQANALLAQVAINSNQPEKALELAELALSQLDNTIYRSRIVATSVVGEVNHVLGKLDRALPMMQQTEKLARQYQVYHQARWAILQQSEILIAQGYVQAAFELQDSAFRLIEDQQLQNA